jgi:hypothetical protein
VLHVSSAELKTAQDTGDDTASRSTRRHCRRRRTLRGRAGEKKWWLRRLWRPQRCSAPERPSTTTRGHSEQESATTRTMKARRRSLSLLLGAARHVGDRTRASLPGSRDGTTRGLVHACAWCTPRCCARYMARGRVHHDKREDQYASVWMRHHLAEWPARVLLSAWARQRRYLLHFLFHLRIFENAILQKVTTNLKISKNKSCRGAINL